MEISVLPALLEVFKLFLVVAGIIGVAVGIAWVNFAIWMVPFYVPLMGLIGVSLGFFMHVLGAGWVPVSFFAVVPFAMALAFKYLFKGKHRTPVYFIAPAVVGMVFLFMYPLFYELCLSFTDLNLVTFSKWISTGEIPLVGLENYFEVFRARATGQPFFVVLLKTCLWTVINVFFHVSLGLLIAMVLNQRWLKGVGLYRTILILPWVIPQIILVLVWRTEFNESMGLINSIIDVTNQLLSFEIGGEIYAPLTWIGFERQEWFTNPWSLFTAACVVNIWLGVPFMMVNALGALQSISDSYYEAASIDGASKFQMFKNITLPLLKPVMVPVTMLGSIWTFNNLTVIFLMTDGGRYEGADILVTDLFKQSFTYYRYSFAAAYSFVIFALLCLIIVAQMKISKSSAK